MAWLEDGEVGVYKSTGGEVTLSITNSTGTATIEQSDDAGGYFPMVCNGETMVLDASNTVRSIYAGIEIRVTPTGTKVLLYG